MRAVARARVDERGEMRRNPSVEEPELQVAVRNGDRVWVVRVARLAAQLELGAGAEPRDHVLAPFERDARDLRVKTRCVADRRIGIVQVAVALREDALDELIRTIAYLGGELALSLSKGVKGRLEGELRRRRRGERPSPWLARKLRTGTLRG